MSRAEKRRSEREQPDHMAPLKLKGADVVFALCVSGPRAPNGTRPYHHWVRGPATDHTNAEMTQLLAMLAVTMVVGNVAGTPGLSMQAAMDQVKDIFGRSLEQFVHQAVQRGDADRNLTTVKMGRDGG